MRLGGYLDQVQLPLLGQRSGPFDGNDAERLVGRVVEQPDLWNADLVVDPELSECDVVVLLVNEKLDSVWLSSGRLLDLQGIPGR